MAQVNPEDLNQRLLSILLYVEMSMVFDPDDLYPDEKKVFSQSGGGVPLPTVSTSLLDPSFKDELDEEFGATTGMPWLFTSAGEWQGIGSTCGNSSCTDLVALMPGMTNDVCVAINNSEGITNPSGNPPSLIGSSTFEYVPHVSVNDPAIQAMFDAMNYSGEVIAAGGETNGRSAGCLTMEFVDGEDLNFYYYVLHAQ